MAINDHKHDGIIVDRVDDLNIGDEVIVGTGLSTLDNIDIDFICTIAGHDENGRIILDAQNAVSFDGRNKIRPFFVVDRRTVIELSANHYRLQCSYVLYDLEGMDLRGRLRLRTLINHKEEN